MYMYKTRMKTKKNKSEDLGSMHTVILTEMLNRKHETDEFLYMKKYDFL